MTTTARETANDQAIAERARAIWEKEGRPEGRDTEHWLQAESELLSEVSPAKPKRAAAAAASSPTTAKAAPKRRTAAKKTGA